MRISVRKEGVMTGKLFASILLIPFCLAPFALGGTGAFQSVQSYSVGTNPRAVAVGDFDHDGKLDLAVVNYGDPTTHSNGSVSILFGNGDGTFQMAKNVAIGRNCTSLATGDFNGDGADDLALVRPGDPTVNDDGDVTVFLGNGDGTFRQGQVLKPGKNPSSNSRAIVAADLNRDQRLDLVVVNSNDKTFSVLLGNGDGTFEAPVAYSVALVPSSVFTADLTGNGEKDLAVALGLNTEIWLSNGDGTFRQGSTVAGSGVTEGDFNGDRKADLVLQPFHICLFPPCSPVYPNLDLGDGDGTFQSAISIGEPASAVADWDGDGKLDLVGTSSSNGVAQVLVLQGNGDGTFRQPVSFSAGTAAHATIALAADVTGDNAPDVLLFEFDSLGNIENTVSVLANAGTDFSISASALSPGRLNPGQTATATISLSLLNAFNNPVSLTCSVQPTSSGSPACSLSSNSVTFDGNGKATATLAINAASRVVSRNRFQSLSPGGLLWFPVGFAFLGTGIGVSQKKKLLRMLIGATVLTGLIGQLACGGDAGGAKYTAYTVMVTGTSGATQRATSVTLTAQ